MPPADEVTHPGLPDTVRRVLAVLAGAGHEVALVGGSVRDLGGGDAGSIDNWDVATSARPEQVAPLFAEAVWQNRFGTVTIVGPSPVEVTSYRTEDGYSDRRRPDEVRFGASLEEDLGRRDFTINAVAWVPTDLDAGRGRVVDPFGGRADMEARLLRTVGEPRERFGEDALRLVRAARFAGRFGLAIEPATEAALRELAPTIAAVSPERIRDELVRILAAEVPSRAIRVLEHVGLLTPILPEVAALRGVPQAKLAPGDALDHTLAAVDAVPRDEHASVRIGALLHDIGKATTLADGHFIGHERVGAELAAEVLGRLRVPGWEAARIIHAVRHHMYAYDETWTDAAVRRFIRRLEPIGTTVLFALRRADNAASGVGTSGEANQADLERRLHLELERQPDLLLRSRLAIDGHDLQRELGIDPGPRIGHVLDRLVERAVDDPSLNERSVLLRLAVEVAAER
ncbi:MAG: CCA tRNA nucleotidyltransferase [Chloroflexi bacterium]|nr:CCA tRNA nucleotidyltransferase [Chloroflexota bacterium]